MKKIVCLALALVLILALAGCTASPRTYRRTTETNRYPGTYDGTYRTNLRPRTLNPTVNPANDGTQFRLPRTADAGTNPSVQSAENGITPYRTNKSFNVAS